MADESTITNKADWRDGGNVAVFNMSLKGGALPASFEAKYEVHMSFKDATLKDVRDFVAGGQSARVVLQKTMRTLGVDKLNKMRGKPIKIHVKDVGNTDAFMTPEDRADQLERFFKSQPPEIQAQLLARLNPKNEQ